VKSGKVERYAEAKTGEKQKAGQIRIIQKGGIRTKNQKEPIGGQG